MQPALLERLKDQLQSEWGWRGSELTQESISELVGDLSSNQSVIRTLLDEIDSFRVLDPACGSGHFLTSALEEIVSIRQELHRRADREPVLRELRERTVKNNIYGVDIVDSAVEITKLRLWLSVIAAVDTTDDTAREEEQLVLPDIVFNIRQGNSLIGYTGLIETNGDGNQTQLGSWGPNSVQDKYGDLLDTVG